MSTPSTPDARPEPLTPQRLEELRAEERAFLNSIANDSHEAYEARQRIDIAERRMNYSYHRLRDIREKLQAYSAVATDEAISRLR